MNSKIIPFGAFVLLTWSLTIVGLTQYQGGGTQTTGWFGDSFGFLSCLFSGLAAVGVYATYFKQSEELEVLKSESLTQRFESAFFSLLSAHNDLIESTRENHREQERNGRDAFEVIYWKLQAIYRDTDTMREIDVGDINDVKGKFAAVYAKLYDEKRARLGHYFRFLYHVIKFVDTSNDHCFDETRTRRFYINIVRAQLSSSQQLLLFYNGISVWGEKFYSLIEKYALLHEMPLNELLDEEIRLGLIAAGVDPGIAAGSTSRGLYKTAYGEVQPVVAST